MLREQLGEPLVAQLVPGALLVHTPHPPLPDAAAALPPMILTLLRLKRAHWERGVYLVTGATPGEEGDGEAVVTAVNLTRPMAPEGQEPTGEAAPPP